jgi:energy-coupling factor transporter ATP-binding protein EcfA2
MAYTINNKSSKRLFYEQLKASLLNRIETELYHSIGATPTNETSEKYFVKVGYTTPQYIEEGLVKAMSLWVNTIDNLIARTNRDGEDYIKLWMIRGLTFAEYQLIFDGAIDENTYTHFRGFAFLRITDRISKLKFTSQNAGDFKTYIEVLQRFKVPIFKLIQESSMPINVSMEALHRHAYITGGSGSGKSELLKLMIYDLQRTSTTDKQHSIIVIDPHGDLVFECLGFTFNRFQDRIIYINPYINRDFSSAEKYTPVINPFQIGDKSEDSINHMTQQLTGAFMEILEDVSVSFQMDMVLAYCINTVLRLPYPTIDDLVRFMDDDRNKDLVEFGRKNPIKRHRDFFDHKFNIATYKQTKNSIMTRLETLLANPEFENLIVGNSTIDLEREMDSGKVILFNLAQGRLGDRVSSAYGRLIVAYIQGLVKKRVDIEKEQRKSIFLFIDECQYFLSPSVKEILTGTRKFGLHLILSQQVIGQDMTGAIEQIVMGNTSVKITGNNERKSLEQFSLNTGADLDALLMLENYTFYVHNRKEMQNRKPFLMKTPSFLADLKSNHYLTKTEMHDLLKWLAETSGYYRKHQATPSVSEHNNDSPTPPTSNNESLKPAFNDF